MKGNNPHMSIYDLNMLDKMISLSYSLSVVISKGFSCHLGSFGTHWLEHFFGNIRSLSKGNNTPKMFEHSVLTLIYKKLMKGSVLDGKVNGRSDSGTYLESMETKDLSSIEIKPFGSYLHEATILLIKDVNQLYLIDNPNNSFLKIMGCSIFEARDFLSPGVLMEFLGKNFNIPEYASTIQARMTDSYGYSTIKKNVQSSQI